MTSCSTYHAEEDAFIIHKIASFCDQRTKLSLVKCDRTFYSLVLPLLYSKVVLLSLKEPLKSIHDLQPFLKFQYPPDFTIISKPKSIKIFFKRVNGDKFNFSCNVKLVSLIKNFTVQRLSPCHFQYINRPNYELSPYFTQEFFDEYQNDCERCIETLPPYITQNIIRLLHCLNGSCQALTLPSSLHSKITKILDEQKSGNFNTILKRLSSYRSSLVQLESSFGILLSGLSSLTISFSDIELCLKVLQNCDPVKLKHLKLTHLTCVEDLSTKLTKNYDLRYLQMGRKFKLIDLFFRSDEVYEIFRNLESLELIVHNGFNRILFRKVLFSIHHFITERNKIRRISDVNNTGKLRLKSFRITETLGEQQNIFQPKLDEISAITKILKKDILNFSSVLMIPDIFQISKEFSLFDIIDFTTLEEFELSLHCFFYDFDKIAFEKRYLLPLWRKIEQETIENQTKKISVRVDNYADSVIGKSRVIYITK